MLEPERNRFERDKRNRPRPPEGADQAKAVPPIEDIYKPTIEDLQRQLRRLQSERSAIIKLKVGDNTVRVMPYRERGLFFEMIRDHYGVGPRRRGMRCFGDFNEACCLCEKVAELSKSPDPDDQAEAKAMKQTKRCLLYVIMLDEPEKGVQVLSLPVSSVAKLMSYFGDPELQDWLHPEHGRNVKIRKTGEGLLTRYSDPILSPRTSPIPNNDWRREIKDLSELFGRPSYEAQRRLYEGIDGGEEVS
jgi:hypothetical protein